MTSSASPAVHRFAGRPVVHQCPAALALPDAHRAAVLLHRLPRWPGYRRHGLHRPGADPGLGHRPCQPRPGNERRADRHGLRRPRLRATGRPLRAQAGAGRRGHAVRRVQRGVRVQRQPRPAPGAAPAHRHRPGRRHAQRHHAARRVHSRAPQVAAGDQHVLRLQPGYGRRRIHFRQADPGVRLAQPAAAGRRAAAGIGRGAAALAAGVGTIPGGAPAR